MKITFSRFPWQKRDPHWSHPTDAAPKWGWGKTGGMARFGGGWDYKLGIAVSGRTIIVDLLFGSVRIELR